MKKINLLLVIILLLITGCDYREKDTEVSNSIDNVTILTIDAVWKDKKCVPTLLNLYKNGKYEFYTTYKEEIQDHLETPFYVYTKSDKGTYKFDLSKIIQGLNEYNNTEKNVRYRISDIESGKTYIIKDGEDNKHLKELLKSIDVDLDICAKEDITS